MSKIRVAVLFGGKSAEHEISLVSARNIIDGLDRKKYEVIPIGIDRGGRWRLAEDALSLLGQAGASLPLLNAPTAEDLRLAPGESRSLQTDGTSLPPIDVVFPILHGSFGEDGSVQGLLRVLGLPCVGPGVAGSAIGMDKDIMKRLLRDAGIPIARFFTVRRFESASIDRKEIFQNLGSPVYVKPVNLGSSVGISRAGDDRELAQAIELAFEYDNKVLIEENIVGREIECAVLGNSDDPIASIPGEIIPKDGFYSYESKYYDEKGAVLSMPAKLDSDQTKRIQELAIRTFRLLELDGMTRVDMFLTETNELVINEVNTIPGFTPISMYPKLWELSGMPLPQLLDRLIQLAIQKHKQEQSLRTSVDIPGQ